MDEDYEHIMKLIESDLSLCYPDNSESLEPLEIYSDSSGYSSGAVLSQVQNGERRIIAYHSSVYTGSVLNYNISDKELLSIARALDAFRVYIIGRHVKVYSDHKPLMYLENLRGSNQRLARLHTFLQNFDFKIYYIAGEINGISDFLSRLPGDRINEAKNKGSSHSSEYLPPTFTQIFSAPGGGNSLIQVFLAFEQLEATNAYAKELSTTTLGKLVWDQEEIEALRETLHKELMSKPKVYGINIGKDRSYWNSIPKSDAMPPGEYILAYANLRKRDVFIMFGGDIPVVMESKKKSKSNPLPPLYVQFVGSCHYNLLFHEPTAKICYSLDNSISEKDRMLLQHNSIKFYCDEFDNEEIYDEELNLNWELEQDLYMIYKCENWGTMTKPPSALFRPDYIQQSHACNKKGHFGISPAVVPIEIGNTRWCTLLDTGCSSSSISEDMAITLINSGNARKTEPQHLYIEGANGQNDWHFVETVEFDVRFSPGKSNLVIRKIKAIVLKQIGEQLCSLAGMDILSVPGWGLNFHSMKLEFGDMEIADLGALMTRQKYKVGLHELLDHFSYRCNAHTVSKFQNEDYINEVFKQIKYHTSYMCQISSDQSWRKLHYYITEDNLRLMQKCDTDIFDALQVIKNETEFPTRLKKYFKIKQNLVTYKDALCVKNKNKILPLVDDKMMIGMLIVLHTEYCHIGFDKMLDIVNGMVFHTQMREIATSIAQCCPQCQFSKQHMQSHKPDIRKINPDNPFDLCSMDVAYMPPTKFGYKYFLIFIDIKSKWIQCEPLKDKSAKSVIKAFIDIILPSLIQVPVKLYLDSDKSFVSNEFKLAIKSYNIKITHSTPYKHCSQGCVERAIRTVRGLTRPCSAKPSDWVKLVKKAVMHEQVTVPLVERKQMVWKHGHPNFIHYKENDCVVRRIPFQGNRRVDKCVPLYDGPYLIVSVFMDRSSYTVRKIGSDKVLRVHHTQLRLWKMMPEYIKSTKEYQAMMLPFEPKLIEEKDNDEALLLSNYEYDSMEDSMTDEIAECVRRADALRNGANTEKEIWSEQDEHDLILQLDEDEFLEYANNQELLERTGILRAETLEITRTSESHAEVCNQNEIEKHCLSNSERQSSDGTNIHDAQQENKTEKVSSIKEFRGERLTHHEKILERIENSREAFNKKYGTDLLPTIDKNGLISRTNPEERKKRKTTRRIKRCYSEGNYLEKEKWDENFELQDSLCNPRVEQAIYDGNEFDMNESDLTVNSQGQTKSSLATYGMETLVDDSTRSKSYIENSQELRIVNETISVNEISETVRRSLFDMISGNHNSMLKAISVLEDGQNEMRNQIREAASRINEACEMPGNETAIDDLNSCLSNSWDIIELANDRLLELDNFYAAADGLISHLESEVPMINEIFSFSLPEQTPKNCRKDHIFQDNNPLPQNNQTQTRTQPHYLRDREKLRPPSWYRSENW